MAFDRDATQRFMQLRGNRDDIRPAIERGGIGHERLDRYVSIESEGLHAFAQRLSRCGFSNAPPTMRTVRRARTSSGSEAMAFEQDLLPLPPIHASQHQNPERTQTIETRGLRFGRTRQAVIYDVTGRRRAARKLFWSHAN